MTVSLLQNDLKKNQENIRLDKSNPKIYFVNCLGNLMSIYREVLFGAKVNENHVNYVDLANFSAYSKYEFCFC